MNVVELKSAVVVILTRNEELNLGAALSSIPDSFDILVIDADSQDSTRDIARRSGAKVHSMPWRGFARQRQAALDLIQQYEWVLFLDADERIEEDLAAEIEDLRRGNPGDSGYYIRRHNYFLGKSLQRAGRYPDWQLRLMRPNRATFPESEVHERAVISGSVGRLKGHIRHESFHSVTSFLEKHRVYAELEAMEKDSTTSVLKLFSGDISTRRHVIKQRVWLKLPCRGLIRMFWILVINRGILDGRAAWAYAKMLAAYESQIDVYRSALLISREKAIDNGRHVSA